MLLLFMITDIDSLLCEQFTDYKIGYMYESLKKYRKIYLEYYSIDLYDIPPNINELNILKKKNN